MREGQVNRAADHFYNDTILHHVRCVELLIDLATVACPMAEAPAGYTTC